MKSLFFCCEGMYSKMFLKRLQYSHQNQETNMNSMFPDLQIPVTLPTLLTSFVGLSCSPGHLLPSCHSSCLEWWLSLLLISEGQRSVPFPLNVPYISSWLRIFVRNTTELMLGLSPCNVSGSTWRQLVPLLMILTFIPCLRWYITG